MHRDRETIGADHKGPVWIRLAFSGSAERSLYSAEPTGRGRQRWLKRCAGADLFGDCAAGDDLLVLTPMRYSPGRQGSGSKRPSAQSETIAAQPSSTSHLSALTHANIDERVWFPTGHGNLSCGNRGGAPQCKTLPGCSGVLSVRRRRQGRKTAFRPARTKCHRDLDGCTRSSATGFRSAREGDAVRMFTRRGYDWSAATRRSLPLRSAPVAGWLEMENPDRRR